MSDALTKARAWINGTFVHEWDGLTMSERENSLAALLTQVRNETLEEAALKMEARRAAFKANAGSLRRSLALRALSMSDAFAHAAHDLRSLKSPG